MRKFPVGCTVKYKAGGECFKGILYGYDSRNKPFNPHDPDVAVIIKESDYVHLSHVQMLDQHGKPLPPRKGITRLVHEDNIVLCREYTIKKILEYYDKN